MRTKKANTPVVETATAEQVEALMNKTNLTAGAAVEQLKAEQPEPETPAEPEPAITAGGAGDMSASGEIYTPAPAELKPRKTVSDVLALKAQYEAERQQAVDQLLAERIQVNIDYRKRLEDIANQLTELGHESTQGELFETGAADRKPATKKQAAGAGAAGVPFCKVCQLSGHDGRAHRHHPAKFKADELNKDGSVIK